ncbi:helix-turn-helix transcriptional regulator [Vibrio owensii]|uniref:helix-turn-helix transcriptional regulator n=1 Tax=Vibrio owensii TaxID=696485 RepID=UPI0018F23ED8|nr:helix-turn-helix transcriptional regulator [Vibrio owensii]
MKIETQADVITLRFLLSLGTQEFGELLGISHFKVETIESGKSELKRRHCLALRSAIESAPNSAFIKERYYETNRDKYVAFLQCQTEKTQGLPRFTPHRCCSQPELKLLWEQGRMRTQASASCSNCGKTRPVKSVSLMRSHLLQCELEFDLFNPNLYNFGLWKANRQRLTLSKLGQHHTPKSQPQMEIDTPNKLIAARALLCLSQQQLAESIGMERTAIHRLERGTTPISKTIGMAILGLIFEQNDRFPHITETFKNLDHDSLADFLITRTRASNSIMSYINHPECKRCNSMLLELTKKDMTINTFNIQCLSCRHTMKSTNNKNLARLHSVRSNINVDLMDPELYHVNTPPKLL